MNTLDLTKTGGFPFTQDMLDWIQQNGLGVMNMLGAKLLPDGLTNTPNTPVGLVGINPGDTVIYKAGYLWYNNEILHFPVDIDTSGLPALSPGSGLVYGFSIQEMDTPVSYFDGTVHNTKISRTVTIVTGADTLTASFIPLTTTIYYFDNGLREIVETHIPISVSSITGDIYYRKNYLNNTLQVRGLLSIPASVINPPSVITLATLPVAYRPISQSGLFTGYYRYVSSYLTDVSGIDFIRNVHMELQTNGSLNILPIPAAGVYSIMFNTIIPLD